MLNVQLAMYDKLMNKEPAIVTLVMPTHTYRHICICSNVYMYNSAYYKCKQAFGETHDSCDFRVPALVSQARQILK